MTDEAQVQSDAGNVSERPLLFRPAGSYTSFAVLWQVLKRRRRMIGLIEAGLLLLCLLYCIVAPNQYEASAWVEMRSEAAPSLSLEANQPVFSASILSAPMALETQANVFRSDQLAWRVITGLKLYQAAGFKGRFEQRFAGFNADHPSVAAKQWLLGRFRGRLHVQALPRTLILEIRFRSHDAALSAEVVNTLIHGYQQEQSEQRRQVALADSDWLNSQLKQLRQHMDEDQKRLDAFRTAHGVLSQPQPGPSGVAQEVAHDSILQQIDDLGKQLVEATSDRILSEAEVHAAEQGDPELVVASDPHLQAAGNEFPVALLQQLRARRSDLDLERAQLSAEHGPNFPRVVEIGRQLQDLETQKKAEDAHLLANFRSALGTARSREQMVRKNLEELTAEGLKQNEAETEFARMRQEANTSQLLYSQVLAKMQESGITAGLQSGNLSIVDPALTPSRPVAPNPPLYLAIVAFVGLWIAVVAALLAENLGRGAHKAAALLLLLALGLAAPAHGQAPTPSTSGLPAGVARIASSQPTQILPNPQESPTVWNGVASMAVQPGTAPAMTAQAAPMAALISPDDLLDVSEFHAPEFHTVVRVSATGAITLPMIDQVKVAGLSEQQAAHAIEAALVAKGMLLHPLVSVVVTQYSGQDVSVLGEVTRPGVYPYTVHHRLLDLLSAASGLAPTAGRLVNIYHREDSKTPHPVVLDPGGNDALAEHNPELQPGDTVQVSRAGLVYVIGAVIRPGGFPVDPAQGLTVVQALSLAWGPAQNASAQHALLIREQKGGRTMTTLNLHRMLRGQEPDLPIRDRDILFVPDSTARNLWNRTLESSIQSLVGVTIYSALVYSQRY